jgi:hypothetical protein
MEEAMKGSGRVGRLTAAFFVIATPMRFSTLVLAQQGAQGQNAVCTSSTGCSGTIGRRVAQPTAFVLL